MRILPFLAIAPFLHLSALATTVTLAWQPSSDPTTIGYHLYYGGASQTYTNMVAVGSATNGCVTGLAAGGQYYFAVTAVDAAGLESPYSNEVSYQVPGGAAQLVVTPANLSRAYGATNPPLTGAIVGLQNGDNITATYSTVATPSSPAGTYTIVPTLIDPNGELAKYTVTTNNGTLTVTPAPLTIAAGSAAKSYGAPLPTLAVTYLGFVNGNTAANLTTPPTLTTTATASSPVGSYPITASGAASPNYAINYTGGTLGVGAAPLTITAVSANKVYGAALPTLTATYSGFVNGDTAANLTTPPTLTTTATASSPVGTYPITVSGAASQNYAISYVGGTLSVTPAGLTITAVSTSKIYGAPLPTLTASYSGFVNGDAPASLTTLPSLTTTATATSPVGSYPITASGAASPNYTISYANGTLSVIPAAPAPGPGSAAKVTLAWQPSSDPTTIGYHLYYGGASQTYTNMVAVGSATNGCVTGLAAGGQYYFAVTAVDAAGLESPYSNEVSYQVPGGAAQLVVTPANLSRAYGATNPPLTGAIVGLQNGDNITATYSTVATPSSPAGTYTIVPTLIDPNGELAKYTVTTNNGTLTVTPAPLTIAAGSAAKSYGAPLPTLAVTYLGFVNGDTAANLTTPPTLTTTATASSPVGSYPITASGAAGTNYAITYTSGALNVIQASTSATLSSSANPSRPGRSVTFTLTLKPVAPGAGTPTGTVQFEIDGAPAGSPVSLSGGVAKYATSSLSTGSHTIASQYAGNADFLGTTNVLSSPQVVRTQQATDAVTVTEPAEAGQSCSLSITNLGNGFVAIGGQGAPGATYTIQYTPDPLPATNWLTLGAATADFSGAFVLVDTNILGLRFYRAVCP